MYDGKGQVRHLKVGEYQARHTPIQIQNCVATFSLGLKNLNLRDISQRLVFCDFNPPKFAAMTIRIREPKTAALTFSSGNMVCTGSKNIHESLLACRKYTRLLQNAGINVCFQGFHIQNIVASAGVPFSTSVEAARERSRTLCVLRTNALPRCCSKS